MPTCGGDHRRFRRRVLPALVLFPGLLVGTARAQEGQEEPADPELERVAGMVDEAREEISEFREAGGEADDPQHPGRRWADALWRYRGEHPGTPAAARATTESVHFMLHAGLEEEAVGRALAVPAEDGAWPTLIAILFEAAELLDEYGFFVEKVQALIEAEEEPVTLASLRFRLAQALWAEGDVRGAEATLSRLGDEAPDPDWRAYAATAREEIEQPAALAGRRSPRDLWQRPGGVMDALDVGCGDAVADVGSGSGYFSFLLASRVCADGRVYAVDVSEESLERLAARAGELGLEQIETVLGADDDPRLPAGKLAAILVVDTYHEMRSYDGMMTGMHAALAPAGRLAIVDIPDELGREREQYHERHRIPVEMVIEEAVRAGFRLRSFTRDFVAQPRGRRFYLVVFDKPDVEGEE